MKSFKLLLVIVAGTTTAALLYFGTGLHPIWPLLWFAPIPVIAIAPHLRASRAFALATVAWFFGANEFMEASRLRHRSALAADCCLVSDSGNCFCSRCFVRAQLSSARLALSRCDRVSILLGELRISERERFATQHLRESRLYADELSASYSNSIFDWNLGHQLRRLPVCRSDRSPFERGRESAATAHGRHCNGSCPLCSLSFWRFAIAIESARAIARRHAHREGRADESLSRFRTASVGTVGRVC